MAFKGKFIYMTHHFILLRLNSFDIRVDREGWQFEHSVSQLRVCFSAEDAKNVLWQWLAMVRRWGSLAFVGNFVYMVRPFILLRFNPFDLKVDWERWWFEHSGVSVVGLLITRGC